MAIKDQLFMIFLVLVLLICSRWTEASVHDYTGERFTLRGNAFVLHGGSEGLYASRPSSAVDPSAPNAGDSFIRFEKITFRRVKKADNLANNTSVSVKAIMFELEDRESIGGSAYGGQRAICCTPDLAKLGACTEGAIIYRHSKLNPGWPQVFVATFSGADSEATLPSRTIPITQTGMYNLYFIYCDPTLEGLSIQGKTIWKNPGGYLPGRMGPLLKFYTFMSFAYLLLGLSWFFQYVRFWKEVMPLQNCISLVIALGMLETTLWYFEYAEFNETGIRPRGITFWAVTSGAVKRTVSRLLVLIFSMGYGVVRPTLGGLTSKVTLLGGTFFLASEILESVENVGTVSDVSGKPRLFLALPVAVLDAFFIIWIFSSLSNTLNKLQARRMTMKLEIYRKFTNALVVTVVVSIIWMGFEINFKSTDAYGERWQSAWIIPALWQLVSFSLLGVISSLWAPSQNSTRYAYSDDGGEDFDREDIRPLTKPGPFSYKDSWSVSVTPHAKLNLASKENAGMLDVAGTEEEEDKRE